MALFLELAGLYKYFIKSVSRSCKRKFLGTPILKIPLATGRLDSLVAIPHTLGNWRCCRTPQLRRPRFTTRQPPHTTNAVAQLQPTAISTSARTTTSLYRRILHHITGRNKRSFSGPHKLYGVDCHLEQRHPHKC
jgi:hypothetical protein